jgi:protein-S-isoprenylcysteine O-methyltransferase Ste14
MASMIASTMRFLRRTPVQTFVVIPLVTLAWELAVQRSILHPALWFAPLMIWGYLQYRLCGRYRIARGGGGPGLETPPEKLVSTGLYAYTRNPMYLGHIIFLIGVTLTLRSWLALLITIGRALWFHKRVIGDEKKLVERLGQPYIDYLAKVKRWIPGLF